MQTLSGQSLYPFAAVLRRRLRFILALGLLSLVLGLITYFVMPKVYKADTVFVLKNPLYSDRNNLYNNETKFINYFAGDDDIDRLITITESDEVQTRIINDMGLAKVYRLDTSNPRQALKLRARFAGNFKIYRSEKNDVVLLFYDKDPKRAARVANHSVGVLEAAFRNFYQSIRLNMYGSILAKIREQDSTLNLYTDSLIGLRKKYGINDIISPSRHNIMLSSLGSRNTPDFAEGIEIIQNVESVKDEIVSARSRNITLADQYATGNKTGDMSLVTVVRRATEPDKPSGVGLFTVVAGCVLAGLFFAILYVLIADFLHRHPGPRS